MAALPFTDQLLLLERFLDRKLPAPVRELLRSESLSRRLLPLATGHEFDPPTPNASLGDAFAEAHANLDSVLGHAMSNSEASQGDPDHVWPPGLLVVEDCGCAIYRAIDLDSPELRVIEYQLLDPVDDPEEACAPASALAYSEPVVPRPIQHRFVIVAVTLDDWLGART
jgi:hypothetical protein